MGCNLSMNSILFNHCDPIDFLQGATGKGIRVAVVDSGVDSQHPDLVGRVKGGIVLESVNGQLTKKPYDGCDVAGHGTGCAGIIARLAPEADIYSVRVLTCTGVGSDGSRYAGGMPRDMIEGINWAIENCQIVNISNGLEVTEGTRSQYFRQYHELIEKAYYQNCLLIAAGENAGRPSYPSIFSNLIKVYWGAFDNPLHFLYQLKPRSLTEFVAHGDYVRIPQPGGGYVQQSGSSFAAPHLSAICALLISKYPQLKSFEVKTILYAMAEKTQSSDATVMPAYCAT